MAGRNGPGALEGAAEAGGNDGNRRLNTTTGFRAPPTSVGGGG